MDFKEKLKARAEKEGISLTPKQLGQFELFYKMLIETNKSMNLTAITDEDEVIEKQKATLAAWEELKKGLLQQMFV